MGSGLHVGPTQVRALPSAVAGRTVEQKGNRKAGTVLVLIDFTELRNIQDQIKI